MTPTPVTVAEKLAKLLEKSTPGKWALRPRNIAAGSRTLIASPMAVDGPDRRPLATCGMSQRPISESIANAESIHALRNSAEFLLAAAREVKAAREAERIIAVDSQQGYSTTSPRVLRAITDREHARRATDAALERMQDGP